jgi:excisionase family DNA binding protein
MGFVGEVARRSTVKETFAYSLAEARAVAGIGRTTMYKLIRERKLRAVKIEGRSFILSHDLRRWLDGMPPIVPDKGLEEKTTAAASEIISAELDVGPATECEQQRRGILMHATDASHDKLRND